MKTECQCLAGKAVPAFARTDIGSAWQDVEGIDYAASDALTLSRGHGPESGDEWPIFCDGSALVRSWDKNWEVVHTTSCPESQD